MNRYYCDLCGEEVQRSANRDVWTLVGADPFEPRKQVKVQADVMVTINGTTNHGHICRNCVVKVVQQGDVERGR